MNLKNKKIFPIIEAGIVAGVVTFILTFLITLWWQQDGLGIAEFSFLPLVAGIFLFFVIVITNGSSLNNYIRIELKQGRVPVKKVYIIMIVLCMSLFVYTFIDFVVFQFDDSLPKDYAESLAGFIKMNGDSTEGIDDFSKWSFGIQNFITNLIMGILGSLISLFFVKNDGQLFKTKIDRFS